MITSHAPRSLSIDTATAELFLTGIPLRDLTEECKKFAVRQRWLEQQHDVGVGLAAHPTNSNTIPSEPQPRIDLLRSRSDSVEKLRDKPTGGFDITCAEMFLRSLEADPPSEEEEFVSAKPLKAKPISAKPLKAKPIIDCLDADVHDAVQPFFTVIGGWRNSADLDRIMPGLVKKGLIGGRMIMSTQRTSTYICSTRPFVTDTGGILDLFQTPNKSPAAGWRYLDGWTGGHRSGPVQWVLRMARGTGLFPYAESIGGRSYAKQLLPSDDTLYDPHSLDDQTLKQGKHHTVLQLESYHVSVIPFLRPRRLKEELNEQFRSSHTHIHPSITLSKLRNLQKDLREITYVIKELDIATVAMAWSYFEKLVLSDRVRKSNRKLLAGACLVLAFKFHQHGERGVVRRLAAAIRRLDRKDQLNVGALHDAELQVFVWLEFGLHIPCRHMLPHLKRSFKDLGQNFEEYYDLKIELDRVSSTGEVSEEYHWSTTDHFTEFLTTLRASSKFNSTT